MRRGFWLFVKLSLDALLARRPVDPGPAPPTIPPRTECFDPPRSPADLVPRSPRQSIYFDGKEWPQGYEYPHKREDRIHNGQG